MPTPALENLPLFRGLDPDQTRAIAALLERRSMRAGEVLCRRGDPGDELYVVASGAVDVRQGDLLIRTVTAGAVLGELSILSSAPRSADLVAREDGDLWALGATPFLALLDRHPSIARSMLGVLASRFRETASRQLRVEHLVRAYRERGHVLARLDPLDRPRDVHAGSLELGHHGLGPPDLEQPYSVELGDGPEQLPLSEILDHLRRVYCGAVGVQYMHIDDPEVQDWLRVRLEGRAHRPVLHRDEQVHLLQKLTEAEVFETTLQRRFPRNKRFSLEGAETLVALLDRALERAAEQGVDRVVLGMSHRGRLNVLANLLGMSPRSIFERLERFETQEPPDGGGDVPFHLGQETVRETRCGRAIRVSLCFNPSHLECVGPVVCGRARALQEARGDDGSRVMPLIVHGDAAFAGQGIVQELLNLSGLEAYRTGGTVHVVLNNQIGFTTLPRDSRSTMYATDVARMLQVPVFHVNGERPEAVDAVIRLALDFRERFGSDVVVDMYCLRRHGHAEEDDPSFTQPRMYRAIQQRGPLREVYARNLVALGQISADEAAGIVAATRDRLEAELESPTRPRWDSAPAESPAPVQPDRSRAALTARLNRLSEVPAGLKAHAKVASLLKRRSAMASGRPVDWGTAELLAYATVLDAGLPVRLTGQDSRRGTFAHRHAWIWDQETGAAHALLPGAGIYNSPLSEAAVLAFEFGYSLDRPLGLTVWEAQFGDFANGAQVIIDQFVVSSAEKWRQHSGICLFLPHGLEGKGPEHSSARPERFLQLAVAGNVRIVHLSTAAQVFHALVDQATRLPRTPLVVLMPKRLLQHRSSTSPLEALSDGAFQPVLASGVRADAATRLVVTTGQLGADLERELEKADRAIRLLRLELLHPFPEDALRTELAGLPADATVCFAQEEPVNMGALPFLAAPLEQLCGRPVERIGRPASASPATGWRSVHEREHAEIVAAALGA